MYLTFALLFLCNGLGGGDCDLDKPGVLHCETEPTNGEAREFVGRDEGDVLGWIGVDGKIHQVKAQGAGVQGEDDLEAFGKDACPI